MKLVSFLCIVSSLFIGCATTSSSERDEAILIDFGRGRLMLQINKLEWAGLWGAEGYIGYRYRTYYAGLEGGGPVYADPPYEEISDCSHFLGTITIDRERNRVIVKIKRVNRGRETTDPGSGTYAIKTVRKPGPHETWFFKDRAVQKQ
jgi:hypothetical protein